MALWQLTADAAWRDYNDGFPAPVVQEGCPSPPALYDPIAGPYISETLFHVRGRVVDSASYFKVHVYVLPEEEIDRVTGRWRETTEEEFCSFDVCYSVTEGLYVSLSDAKNPDLMRNLVADAIGLR
jgi:hypothetical protein